jgi:hypothetical protein
LKSFRDKLGSRSQKHSPALPEDCKLTSLVQQFVLGFGGETMDDEQRQAILSQFTSDELFAEWGRREDIEFAKLLDELDKEPTLEELLRDTVTDETTRRTSAS